MKELITSFAGLISTATLVVASIALLGFFFGLMKFIFQAGDEKSHESGKNIMIWGLVALFVMMSVWGLVRFFQEGLGLPQVDTVRPTK